MIINNKFDLVSERGNTISLFQVQLTHSNTKLPSPTIEGLPSMLAILHYHRMWEGKGLLILQEPHPLVSGDHLTRAGTRCLALHVRAIMMR